MGMACGCCAVALSPPRRRDALLRAQCCELEATSQVLHAPGLWRRGLLVENLRLLPGVLMGELQYGDGVLGGVAITTRQTEPPALLYDHVRPSVNVEAGRNH